LYKALFLVLTFTALISVQATAVILVVSCAPFATALFAAAAGQERLDAGRLLGVAAGCGGVAVMALGQPMTTATAFGVGCVVLGMLAFSLGTVVYRGRAGDAVGVNFWQSVAGCGAMIPLSLVFGRPGAAARPVLAVGVAYLAPAAGVVGVGLGWPVVAFSFRPSRGSIAPLTAAPARTWAVCWKDAALRKLSVARAALVMP